MTPQNNEFFSWDTLCTLNFLVYIVHKIFITEKLRCLIGLKFFFYSSHARKHIHVYIRVFAIYIAYIYICKSIYIYFTYAAPTTVYLKSRCSPTQFLFWSSIFRLFNSKLISEQKKNARTCRHDSRP
jgi:hypothetical protein